MLDYTIFTISISKIIRPVIPIVLGFVIGEVFAQTTRLQPSPWNGRAVFKNKGCILCHSVYGEGGKGGPDLGRDKFYGTYLELAALMWNHLPNMVKRMEKIGFQVPQFKDTEMADLISYLCFIRYRGEPGSEFKGRKLLKSKGCMVCHKFGGKGGDIGPDISKRAGAFSPLLLVECMWNHGPNMMELYQKYNVRRPEFTGNDIVHLATAIQSFMPPTNKLPLDLYDPGNPESGKGLVKEKGCLYCHAIRDVGGKIGPDFAAIDYHYSVTEIAGKMWNHGPAMWKFMREKGISFPVFHKGEMADIIAYLYKLGFEDSPGRPEEGDKLIHERGCLSCHSVQGKGSHTAADLSRLSELSSPLAMITAMWNHAPTILQKHREKKMEWPTLHHRDITNIYAYLHSTTAVRKKAPK